MNWLFVNKILNIVGLKTRFGYLVLIPALRGILKILQSPFNDVHITITTALMYALAISFGAVLVVRDLFCPDLIKGIVSEEEYVKKRTAYLKTLESGRKESYTYATKFTAQQRETLKNQVKPDLLTVLSEKEAEAIAEVLATRIHSVEAVLAQMQPQQGFGQSLPNVDINTMQSQNKTALFLCFTFLGLGAVLAVSALSFVVLPVVRAIWHWIAF